MDNKHISELKKAELDTVRWNVNNAWEAFSAAVSSGAPEDVRVGAWRDYMSAQKAKRVAEAT